MLYVGGGGREKGGKEEQRGRKEGGKDKTKENKEKAEKQ
jgi:hypothetical protein